MAQPGTLIDWTAGTGVIPGGGVITVAANSMRRFLQIQNQSGSALTVGIPCVDPSGNAQVANLILGPGGAGSQGADNAFSFTTLVPIGIVTISGPAGSQVMVLEGS